MRKKRRNLMFLCHGEKHGFFSLLFHFFCYKTENRDCSKCTVRYVARREKKKKGGRATRSFFIAVNIVTSPLKEQRMNMCASPDVLAQNM